MPSVELLSSCVKAVRSVFSALVYGICWHVTLVPGQFYFVVLDDVLLHDSVAGG